jgi:hypothetical protein
MATDHLCGKGNPICDGPFALRITSLCFLVQQGLVGVFQPVSTIPKGGISSIGTQSGFLSSWKSGLEDLPSIAA